MHNTTLSVTELLDKASLICEASISTSVALSLEGTIEQLTTKTMQGAIHGLQMNFSTIQEILDSINLLSKKQDN